MNISYVLPVYNGQCNIAECIRSLKNQNVAPHEIIVLDDLRTDNTLNIIHHVIDGKVAVEKSYEMRQLLDINERKGAAFLRNYGNSIATGDIIAVCDNDWYSPKRGEAIIEFFEKNKDKSVFYSGLNLKESKNPKEQWVMEAYEWDFNSKCPISHPTVAYRKEVSDEIKYHEDSIETDLYEFFLLDCHKAGYLFGGCQNPLMIKTEGDSIRNKGIAKELKQKKYEEYGIRV